MTPISSQAHITRCALAVKYFMQGFLLWATESGWVPGDRGGRELCAVSRAAGVQARQEVLGGRCCWLTAAPSSSSGCPGRAAFILPQAAAPKAFLSLVPVCSPVPPANKWVWSQPLCRWSCEVRALSQPACKAWVNKAKRRQWRRWPQSLEDHRGAAAWRSSLCSLEIPLDLQDTHPSPKAIGRGPASHLLFSPVPILALHTLEEAVPPVGCTS